MIPVAAKPEPEDFGSVVRAPGTVFLAHTPNPTSKQWEKAAYWRRAGNWMQDAYGPICQYSCHWIAYDAGNATIDHFVPRKTSPGLAYEWSNFRYACGRLNSRKGVRAILDPFFMPPDVFEIGFPMLLVTVRATAPAAIRPLAEETITHLGLNDEETCVKTRQEWFKNYKEGLPVARLSNFAPFLAAEIIRQGIPQ
jgi:hypothetical protein